MTNSIVFMPLLPWVVVGILVALLAAGIALAVWRRLAGWAPRSLAGCVIAAALLGPAYQQEEREPLSDIVLLIEDHSESQTLGNRISQTQAAADEIETILSGIPNTEVHRKAIFDSQENAGTELMTGLAEALAAEPGSRVAGTVLITDGQVHDAERAPQVDVPVHLLISGKRDDWDRRIEIKDAPAFGILGEDVPITFRVEELGPAPELEQSANVEISINGKPLRTVAAPVGEDVKTELKLPHGGRNVIEFSIPAHDGELAIRNNVALMQINGVRDRLNVLLVSGMPHAGGRTWRNILKSDSSVDLVHFTILRPTEKQDGVPVRELSLIAFPTRELFLEKIEDFDLIIFDRYKRRGLLPQAYLENVGNYVENGGAVLIAAGSDFAGASSIYRSALNKIIPARPTARVINEYYRPTITETGMRHPVTSGLDEVHGLEWGRWLQLVEVSDIKGDALMTGAEDRPLLVLDRVGEGRVALLASDNAWLWHRGYEGGGPQLELLRRLAHWLMKEPELEEEALRAESTGLEMRVIRRTLSKEAGSLSIHTPSGMQIEMAMNEVEPGKFEALFDGPEIGIYQLGNDGHSAIIGLGPDSPVEFVNPISNPGILERFVADTGGGIHWLEDGLPRIRSIKEGRNASGRGWIGIERRDAHETIAVRQLDLLPPWAVLLMVVGLTLWGWLREGRR
ncbi:MAG: hypothetical protein OXC72_12460 [Roseovarius sp.]|nr:hypothetical protein [Roseovarius sp.]